MKQILFLCPYPEGESPSQRFRFEQYFPLLDSQNFIYEVKPFLSNTDWTLLYQKGSVLKKAFSVLKGFLKRFILLFQIRKFNFIFIHREAAPLGPPIIEWVIAKVLRKKIIYDFDDAIWLRDLTEDNKSISFLKFQSKVKSICRWSWKVSCGNSYLRDFAAEFSNTAIINPTTIDTVNVHNPALYKTESPDAITIGWTGSHSTLKYLEPIISVIESLWIKYPSLEFVIIANRKPSWTKPFIKFIPWSKKIEISALMNISIGIMPLEDDEWAKGKCGFKALQYMSLEKPALVSPVGVNTSIVQHGVNGYHCSTESEWFEALEYLIHNHIQRMEMGRKGRETVIKHYSVLANSSNFLSLFE